MKYDVKARIINLRESGNYFSSKYRPAFQILDDYATSGEIELIDTDRVEVGEWAEAYIGFFDARSISSLRLGWKGIRV